MREATAGRGAGPGRLWRAPLRAWQSRCNSARVRRRRQRSPIAAACLLLAAPAAFGQVVGPAHGAALHHDVSQPLRRIPARLFPPSGLAMEVNPLRSPPARPRAAAAETGPDARRQEFAGVAPGAAPTAAPLLVVDGLSDADNAGVVGLRVVPGDPQGDIGPEHYVQWINLVLAVWNVTRGADGAPTAAALDAGFGIRAGSSVWSGFGGACAQPSDSTACACQLVNRGDPIVLYDHLADRWLLSQFAPEDETGADIGVQCVALSQTGDPTGAYDRWAFTVSPGQFNDYPKLGLMPDSYLLTVRDFPFSVGTFAGVVAFDRQAMLAGDPSPRTVKFGLACVADCVDGWQPPHLEGPPPPHPVPAILTKVWDVDFDGPAPGCDGVRLWRLDVDWSVPGPSPPAGLAELPAACSAGFDNQMCNFFDPTCIPQASDPQLLDPVDELQMYRAQYRQFGAYESLLVNSTVDADGADTAGIRWIELRDSGGGWAVHQEGTYAPADGYERWMGSGAINGSGQVALGFSLSGGSSPALDPSIAYNTKASEASGEPQDGMLSGGEVVMHAGTGAQNLASRWGDYSAMSVDPADDCTFWYSQQFYETTGSFDFKTRIGAFRPADCVPCSPPTNLAVDGQLLNGDQTHESCGWVTSENTEVQSGHVVFTGRHGVVLGDGFGVTGGSFSGGTDPDLSLP